MNVRAVRREAKKLADAERWKWAQEAACRGEDLELFFGPDGERQPEREVREEKAREVCSGCPVRTQCLNYAVERPEKYGTWGGMNEDGRHSERRRRFRRGALTHVAPVPKDKPKPKPRPDQVDVTGTRRRLQALAVAGHGAVTIAARIGGLTSSSQLNAIRLRESGSVRADVAAAVTRLYPVLILEPPAVNSHGADRLAAERGWWGSEAWEGLDMDDPCAVPRVHETAA